MVEPIRKRDTARGIVVRGNQILLMERWRPGLHYFSVPGGGIETGETREQTVRRELLEETTIETAVERLVLIMENGPIKHYIYLCSYISGEPRLAADAPEALHNSPDNRFKPGWQKISDLPDLLFTYWKPLEAPLIEGLQHGFPAETQMVSNSN